MSRRRNLEVKPDQSSMATASARRHAQAGGTPFTATGTPAPARGTAIATRLRNHHPILRRLLAALPACAFLLAVPPAVAASSAGSPPSAPRSADAPDAANATALAQRLLDLLDAGDYDAAEAMFTPRLAAHAPATMLKNIWEGLPQRLGAAQGRGAASVKAGGRGQRVEIPLRYASSELIAQVGLDGEQRISLFLLVPATQPSPPPAADAAYTERDFSLATPRGELPGTLTLPRGDGPFPAVVLVHGSGPQDRDETIGPNRPFLDIARGLAAQGIAVLRYDKRTRARPQDAAQPGFGIDDETTGDAVAAVAALRATADIAPGRVFVLGHSLGGMLAPRIGLRSESAGLILLAAPSRPLLDVLLNQWRNLAAEARGPIRQQADAAIAGLERGIARVRSGEALPDAESPLGLSADYWRSVDAVRTVDDARHVLAGGRPLLLLQGGRDFQVMDSDWQGWQQGLAGHSGASFRHYPALDHLGIAGTGPGTPADYERPGHVDARLIDDIAGWIKDPR